MTHLRRAALNGANRITVDLLTGRAEPATALSRGARDAIAESVQAFPTFMARAQVSMDVVRAATLVAVFPSAIDIQMSTEAVPATCELQIVAESTTSMGRATTWWSEEGIAAPVVAAGDPARRAETTDAIAPPHTSEDEPNALRTFARRIANIFRDDQKG